ncbi:lysophospholipid transporter LplT [Methylosoma difficile]
MNRGFCVILAAQFFSALADNALLFAAIELLKDLSAPSWQTPVLQQFFVISFIVLAPFVGVFADALPKGKVMFISNAIKVGGCFAMLLGGHPLWCYGVVGMGAALYSPAKYGILAECLPAERLVWGNGWMEGLTVGAVILGAIIGGLLIGPEFQAVVASHLARLDFNAGINSAAKLATLIILLFYALAAVFNLLIPKLPIEHRLDSRSAKVLCADFWRSFVQLWQDPLGQVSLAVTSLFWGAGTTLRFLILSWAAIALHFNLEQATQLTAVVAVGLAIGSVVAAKWVPLQQAVKVLPLGIGMGMMIIGMNWVINWQMAIVLLIIIGALAGSFLIPMNALLQHRGHQMMGSGHSIALQNFNENICILLMLGAYAMMVEAELPVQTILLAFGLSICTAMAWLTQKHWQTQVAKH